LVQSELLLERTNPNTIYSKPSATNRARQGNRSHNRRQEGLVRVRIVGNLRYRRHFLRSQLVWLDGCTRLPPDSPYLGLVTDNGSGSLVSPKIISWSKSSIRRKWQYSASQRNLDHLPPSYLFRQSSRYPARYPHYHEATGNPRRIEERCGGSDEGRSLASFRNLQPYGVTFHTLAW
jgi:hypothetical protein